jgi:hypothetical protein
MPSVPSSNARFGSVLSDGADAEMSRLLRIAAALTGPTVGLGNVEKQGAMFESVASSSGTDPTAAAYTVRLGSGDTISRAAVMALMRDLGMELSRVTQRLHASMEDHFVRFFDHMKRKSDDELSVWLPKADAVTPASAGFGRNPPPAQARAKPGTTQLAQAVECLHTWLAVELESIMTTTHASKGAVYLRASDADGYLRRAASVPASTDLPADVALASGSSIGTVVLTGIGANIELSRRDAFEQEAGRTGRPAHTSAVVFNVSTAVVLPLVVPSSSTPIGCVVIADKREPGQHRFTVADEHRVWSFVAACEGVFARYPHTALLTYTVNRDGPQSLRALAKISPLGERGGSGGDPLLVHGVPVPCKAPKMLLVRQGTSFAAQAAKDAHMDTAGSVNAGGAAASATVGSFGGPVSAFTSTANSPSNALLGASVVSSPSAAALRHGSVDLYGGAGPGASGAAAGSGVPFNDEEVLESVAPYLRNVEELWHKALDTVMTLRGECGKWQDRVAQKEARIIDLEVRLKNLAKQLHRTKADIRRIQRVVPQHLKETLDITLGNTSGGGGDGEGAEGGATGSGSPRDSHGPRGSFDTSAKAGWNHNNTVVTNASRGSARAESQAMVVSLPAISAGAGGVAPPRRLTGTGSHTARTTNPPHAPSSKGSNVGAVGSARPSAPHTTR